MATILFYIAYSNRVQNRGWNCSSSSGGTEDLSSRSWGKVRLSETSKNVHQSTIGPHPSAGPGRAAGS